MKTLSITPTFCPKQRVLAPNPSQTTVSSTRGLRLHPNTSVMASCCRILPDQSKKRSSCVALNTRRSAGYSATMRSSSISRGVFSLISSSSSPWICSRVYPWAIWACQSKFSSQGPPSREFVTCFRTHPNFWRKQASAKTSWSDWSWWSPSWWAACTCVVTRANHSTLFWERLYRPSFPMEQSSTVSTLLTILRLRNLL